MLSLINYSPVVMVMNLTMYNIFVVANYVIIIENISELIGYKKGSQFCVEE